MKFIDESNQMTRCLYITAIIVASVLIVAIVVGLVIYFVVFNNTKNSNTNSNSSITQWYFANYNASLYANSCKPN